jgi:hypothetical protein
MPRVTVEIVKTWEVAIAEARIGNIDEMAERDKEGEQIVGTYNQKKRDILPSEAHFGLLMACRHVSLEPCW